MKQAHSQTRVPAGPGDGAVPMVQVSSTSAASAEWVSVRDYGAVGDGVQDDAAAINAALAAVAARGGGTVLIADGTYRIGSTLQMQPGVRLLGDGRARITQAAAANLQVLVEFGAAAHRAALEQCIIDGNRQANSDHQDVALVHVRHSSDVAVVGNRLLNSNGYGVASNASRTTVRGNAISNCHMQAVGIYSGNGAPSTDAFVRIEDNTMDTLGPGAIIFGNSNYGIIRGNQIQATAMGGRGNRLRVDIAGNVVTRASGPDFAHIKPGMFLVVDNGREYRVAAVSGPSTLTVEGSPPALAGALATVGTGDVIGLVGSSFCTVADNIIAGGATFGIALSLGGGAGQTSNNLIAGNQLTYSGKNAINISWDSGAGFLDNNSVVANKLMNPGNSGGAGADDRIGIFVASQQPGKCLGTFVDANTVISDAGEGQAEYWLGTDGGGAPGSVRVGRNAGIGLLNPGIKRDVLSATPSGWGSAAEVSEIESNGHSLRLVVTSLGSGQSGGPSLVIDKIVTSPEQALLLQAQLTSAGNGAALRTVWGEQLSTPGRWVCYYDGTPVANGRYTITLQG